MEDRINPWLLSIPLYGIYRAWRHVKLLLMLMLSIPLYGIIYVHHLSHRYHL